MPSTAPDHCPACLARNIVATLGGPTCTHQAKSGVAWFAERFDSAGEPIVSPASTSTAGAAHANPP
jgi:hypothetical protein